MGSVSKTQSVSVGSSTFSGVMYLPDTMQSGTTISCSLDFTLAAKGAYYNAENPLKYDLICHQYNQSGQEIATNYIITDRIIYYPTPTSSSTQWSSKKIYNWNITSGWSTAKTLWQQGQMYDTVPNWSYSTLVDWLQTSANASYGAYKRFISMEPLLVRYASDNLGGRRNLYSATSIKTAMKWSSANPYSGTSTPSGGNRDHSHSPVGYNLNLDANTSALSFTVVFKLGNTENARINWPDDYMSNQTTHVNTFSHIYRHNGSTFVKDSVVYQYNNGSWRKCRIYKFDGSNWRALT